MFFLKKIHMKFIKAKGSTLSENTEASLKRLSLLTTLEYKVFMLLREGFSKKECSQRLKMKRGDVENHVKSIYSKLNVRSAAELIVKYRKES